MSDGQSSATCAYNGLGDRLRQTVGGVTTNYTLDPSTGSGQRLNNSLTQVLAAGTDRYLYGMGSITQQTPAGSQYSLPDVLGSVRQLTDAAGALALAQSFDPYGGRLASQGSAVTPYGFAGEWGDASGLIAGTKVLNHGQGAGRSLTWARSNVRTCPRFLLRLIDE